MQSKVISPAIHVTGYAGEVAISNMIDLIRIYTQYVYVCMYMYMYIYFFYVDKWVCPVFYRIYPIEPGLSGKFGYPKILLGTIMFLHAMENSTITVKRYKSNGL